MNFNILAWQCVLSKKQPDNKNPNFSTKSQIQCFSLPTFQYVITEEKK